MKTPDTFYHLTREIYLNAILEEGLKPKIGELSKEIGETEECIYLFDSRDSVENALYNWYGEMIIDLYGEDGIVRMFEIKKEHIVEVTPTFDGKDNDAEESFEWYTKHPIKPEHLILDPEEM